MSTNHKNSEVDAMKRITNGVMLGVAILILLLVGYFIGVKTAPSVVLDPTSSILKPCGKGEKRLCEIDEKPFKRVSQITYQVTQTESVMKIGSVRCCITLDIAGKSSDFCYDFTDQDACPSRPWWEQP